MEFPISTQYIQYAHYSLSISSVMDLLDMFLHECLKINSRDIRKTIKKKENAKKEKKKKAIIWARV